MVSCDSPPNNPINFSQIRDYEARAQAGLYFSDFLHCGSNQCQIIDMCHDYHHRLPLNSIKEGLVHLASLHSQHIAQDLPQLLVPQLATLAKPVNRLQEMKGETFGLRYRDSRRYAHIDHLAVFEFTI